MAGESAFLSRARAWEAFYAEPRVAEFRRRLCLEAFGEEYPADEATDGYITRSELRDMVGTLHVGPGQIIADLGCGRGGPGQWISSATGAALVGFLEISLSNRSLNHRRHRCRKVIRAAELPDEAARIPKPTPTGSRWSRWRCAIASISCTHARSSVIQYRALALGRSQDAGALGQPRWRRLRQSFGRFRWSSVEVDLLKER